MENNDTIQLLKECDSGTKMAVDSINEILDKELPWEPTTPETPF